jgi:hypothetical protein
MSERMLQILLDFLKKLDSKLQFSDAYKLIEELGSSTLILNSMGG